MTTTIAERLLRLAERWEKVARNCRAMGGDAERKAYWHGYAKAMDDVVSQIRSQATDTPKDEPSASRLHKAGADFLQAWESGEGDLFAAADLFRSALAEARGQHD